MAAGVLLATLLGWEARRVVAPSDSPFSHVNTGAHDAARFRGDGAELWVRREGPTASIGLEDADTCDA